MADIVLVHWHEAESQALAEPLRAAGHRVRIHWSSREHLKLKDDLPAALVISLDRLPSHGRAIAEWFWEAKVRRSIPIVFVGGQPEKIAATRARFPQAAYCATAELLEKLATPSSRGAASGEGQGESAAPVRKTGQGNTRGRAEKP